MSAIGGFQRSCAHDPNHDFLMVQKLHNLPREAVSWGHYERFVQSPLARVCVLILSFRIVTSCMTLNDFISVSWMSDTYNGGDNIYVVSKVIVR